MHYAVTIKGKWILMIVNALSKYIDAHVLSSPSSSETERMLRRTFVTHGSPHVIVSDNASSFTIKEFSKFCALNDIKDVRCALYHPFSSELAECVVPTIKRMLKKFRATWKLDYCVSKPDTVYFQNQQRISNQQCY